MKSENTKDHEHKLSEKRFLLSKSKHEISEVGFTYFVQNPPLFINLTVFFRVLPLKSVEKLI